MALSTTDNSTITTVVLGQAKGRLYTAEALVQKFSRALFPRTTNRYGCVTLHLYHFPVAEGVPQTQVLLWVYENQLKAVWDSVVLAEYHCRYHGSKRHVRHIGQGTLYPAPAASPQGTLLPRQTEELVVLYCPPVPRWQLSLPVAAQQLGLFKRLPHCPRDVERPVRPRTLCCDVDSISWHYIM